MEKSEREERKRRIYLARSYGANQINSFGLAIGRFPKIQFFFFFLYFGHAIAVRSRINAGYKSALFLAEKTFRYTRPEKREPIEINPVRSCDDNRVFISGCIMPIAYRARIGTVSVSVRHRYIHFIKTAARRERRHYICEMHHILISVKLQKLHSQIKANSHLGTPDMDFFITVICEYLNSRAFKRCVILLGCKLHKKFVMCINIIIKF